MVDEESTRKNGQGRISVTIAPSVGSPAGRVVARVIGTVATGALLVLAAPAEAQVATPWLAPSHWSGPVLTRLHARGGVWLDPVTQYTPASAGGSWLRIGYRGWQEADWPAAARDGGGAGGLVAVTASAGAGVRRGVLSAGGFTLEREWRPPSPRPDVAGPLGSVLVHAVPTARLALTVGAAADARSVDLEHGTVALALHPVQLWAGRRSIGFAPAEGGGLALNHLARLDGAGVVLLEPLAELLLGEAFGGLLPRNGHVRSPWLLGLRLHARTHARLDIGVTRVAVFGGMRDARPGVREFVGVLAGANLSGDYADDQVASLDARWRPPVRVPLEVYGEWGVHDVDLGVLIDVPAFTAGLRLAALPGAADAGVSLEHTQIARSCCRNPPWYHHFELADGWTTDGELLGHPLGGHGREWRLGANGAAGERILFALSAAARRRGSENLYAPVRQGGSTHIKARADARLGDRAVAALRLGVERAREWREVHASLELRHTF